jgi:hypothetical protein
MIVKSRNGNANNERELKSQGKRRTEKASSGKCSEAEENRSWAKPVDDERVRVRDNGMVLNILAWRERDLGVSMLKFEWSNLPVIDPSKTLGWICS